MGKPTGFKEYHRELPGKRPVAERIKDFKEIYQPFPKEKLKTQAARCMDCGVPTCHAGCPLGNLIPDWNDFIYRDRWRDALDQLLLTNNFPEFTGRLCPAPCEEACVLAINEPPVTIEQIEKEIIEHAFEQGWIKPEPPQQRTGKTVAVIGSGPSGLACAQQLNRAGHTVTVYERADRIGGLLRYGIPDFKLEKWVLDRRLDLMQQEGIHFETGIDVEFVTNGQGRTEMREVPDTIREWPAELVLLAMGFTGPQPDSIVSSRGLKLDERGNIQTDRNYRSNVSGIFAAGDANRGQSLIVWAISEGREVARCVDTYLMGTSMLPAKGGVDLPRA